MGRTSEGHGRELDGWWRLGVAVVRALVGLLFRMRFIGVDWIPLRGPAIIASNHASVLDGPVLCLPPAWVRRRSIRFLVAAEIFRVPAIGWILRTYRQIPIQRGQGDAHALDAAIETVRAGALAGIFPEGHVNADPSELQRVRRGAARISLGSGAPIVPTGIWGTQARWPRGGPRCLPLRRAALTVAFGEPIYPEGDPQTLADVEALTERIAHALEDEMGVARADAEGR